MTEKTSAAPDPDPLPGFLQRTLLFFKRRPGGGAVELAEAMDLSKREAEDRIDLLLMRGLIEEKSDD